jgi:lysozyme family protein
MMDGHFADAVLLILGEEGILNEDPRDNGGVTKYGITRAAVLDYYERTYRPPPADIPAYIRALTREQAIEIYRVCYWLPARCDTLPWMLALPMFDAAVQHGVQMAIRLLQYAVRVNSDGVYGRQTATAAEMAMRTPDMARDTVALFFMHRFIRIYLPHEDWGWAGAGWLSRAFRVSMLAVSEPPQPAVS